MALGLDSGRMVIRNSFERPLATGETVDQEGLAMIQTLESGVEKCEVSNGAASEVFVGFSYGQRFTPVYKSHVENTAVPAASPYTLNLEKTPVSGQLLVVADDSALTVVSGTPTTGQVKWVSGTTLTFNSAQAAATLKITYRYSPTALELTDELQSIDTIHASDYIGQIGLIDKGDIMTDMFDSSVNWAAGDTVYMKSDGTLSNTQSASESSISNAIIFHLPTEDYPYLGVRLT